MADENTLPTDAELFQSTQAVETPSTVTEPETVVTPPEVIPPVDPASVVKEPDAAIPSWRLREETDARRQAEARAQQLEARLNEIASHLRQQQPKGEKPDFFENPDQAVQALIAKAVTPYAEETRSTMLALGQMLASQVHGADKVSAAEKAFLEAYHAKSLDVADYEKVVTAPNRYDAVVQWHKRSTALATVGDDPNAWFQKQLEERMADPKFQAEMLKKVQGGAAARPGAVMIPPSLSKSPGGAGNGATVGDMSDASLFANAMRS